MIDWNDLRYLVAVARTGSTIAAARDTGVSQSTVQRRLNALGDAIGAPLALRTPTGYVLTDLGRALAPFGERVAAEVASFVQRAAAGTEADGGRLRITCPEPIVPRLSPLIDRFRALDRRFRVELVTSDRYLDLKAGDADVALRSGDTDSDLVGRKVADSLWAVYASEGYVAAHGAPAQVADLRDHPLIMLDETMPGHRVNLWLGAAAPDAAVGARATSVLGMLNAARAGLGVAPLPANVADADPALRRLFGPVPELTRSWRLLTPRLLRRTPPVSAFFAFVDRERAAFAAALG